MGSLQPKCLELALIEKCAVASRPLSHLCLSSSHLATYNNFTFFGFVRDRYVDVGYQSKGSSEDHLTCLRFQQNLNAQHSCIFVGNNAKHWKRGCTIRIQHLCNSSLLKAMPSMYDLIVVEKLRHGSRCIYVLAFYGEQSF